MSKLVLVPARYLDAVYEKKRLERLQITISKLGCMAVTGEGGAYTVNLESQEEEKELKDFMVSMIQRRINKLNDV
jgi:hypothetical protein